MSFFESDFDILDLVLVVWTLIVVDQIELVNLRIGFAFKLPQLR